MQIKSMLDSRQNVTIRRVYVIRRPHVGPKSENVYVVARCHTLFLLSNSFSGTKSFRFHGVFGFDGGAAFFLCAFTTALAPAAFARARVPCSPQRAFRVTMACI
jgi:hypothetical protein